MITIDQQLIKKVLHYTGYTEEKYFDLVQQAARAYLDAYMPDYPAVKQTVLKSASFWNWWKRHWEQRDKEFIETCETDFLNYADCIERYNCIHDPVLLSTTEYMHGIVLHESYADMIGKIMKAQTKHPFATHE